MTVSSSAGRRFTLQQHIQRAYNLAGLYEASQTPNAGDMGLGKDLLEGIVDGLTTYNVTARVLTFWTLTLVADQAEYELDEGIYDLVGIARYVPPGSDPAGADDELNITRMTRDQWQRAPQKGSSSTPRSYWPNLEIDPAVVTVYPPPAEAGSIRFQASRHLADCNDLSATLDLHPYWSRFIWYQLAADLCNAKSQSASKVQTRQMYASEELKRCILEAAEPGHIDMEVES